MGMDDILGIFASDEETETKETTPPKKEIPKLNKETTIIAYKEYENIILRLPDGTEYWTKQYYLQRVMKMETPIAKFFKR